MIGFCFHTLSGGNLGNVPNVSQWFTMFMTSGQFSNFWVDSPWRDKLQALRGNCWDLDWFLTSSGSLLGHPHPSACNVNVCKYMFTPCSQTYGNLVLQYFWISISLHKRERERERERAGFAPFNPSLVLWNNSHFRCLQPRCSSILLAKLFSNSSITLKLQVWMKNLGKGTSHRQTDHMCMYVYVCHITLHDVYPVTSHLPCSPTVPSKLPRSLGVLVRTPGTCKKLGNHVLGWWWDVRWSTPKKIRYFHVIPSKYGGKYGCKIMANHSTPHRGAQAVVHVHEFQGWPLREASWTKESNRKLTAPTHRFRVEMSQIWQLHLCSCMFIYYGHLIQEQSLEICIFGFPSLYL